MYISKFIFLDEEKKKEKKIKLKNGTKQRGRNARPDDNNNNIGRI